MMLMENEGIPFQPEYLIESLFVYCPMLIFEEAIES